MGKKKSGKGVEWAGYGEEVGMGCYEIMKVEIFKNGKAEKNGKVWEWEGTGWEGYVKEVGMGEVTKQ